jgi:hypothetical protein
MELLSYIVSQLVHCWCIERLLIFIKLILYPATLLKLFMVSSSFWVEFFGSLGYRIMSSLSRDTLTFFKSICILFIYLFIYLFALLLWLRIPGLWKSRHPCLIPEFRGNHFSFSPLSMMLDGCVFCTYSFYNVDVHSSIPNFLIVFIMKWC